ncbi:MAG: hypothetical protein IPH44_12190 [Myxococcales bacterium]|nr:hypothetical protein [Myxococcales bacterium]MBK7194191.1 hypothetical protein [Myxococcales bacterium]MBP6844939.1 hypothetical protein [Kofleriaceae bacterium]
MLDRVRALPFAVLPLVVACGGGARPTTPPASPPPSGDACAAGVRLPGVPTAAATWDDVRAALGDAAEACTPDAGCGPDLAVSVVPEHGAIVVKSADGYHVATDLWEAYSAPPQVTTAALGALTHVAVRWEELGREEVCDEGVEEGSGECGSATVVVSSNAFDAVVDPSAGALVWQATCSVEGDVTFHAPAVAADDDAFSYTPCATGATTARFAVTALAACGAP